MYSLPGSATVNGIVIEVELDCSANLNLGYDICEELRVISDPYMYM
jgi:hypothetical protein